MFKEVFIVQCKSSGEFLTTMMNYTYNLNRAGFFNTRQEALDTAVNEFQFDFEIYSFFKRESDLPVNMGRALCPPM